MSTDSIHRLGLTWADLEQAAEQARRELGADADSVHLLERTTVLLVDRARLQTPATSMTAASDDEVHIAQLEAKLAAAGEQLITARNQLIAAVLTERESCAQLVLAGATAAREAIEQAEQLGTTVIQKRDFEAIERALLLAVERIRTRRTG